MLGDVCIVPEGAFDGFMKCTYILVCSGAPECSRDGVCTEKYETVDTLVVMNDLRLCGRMTMIWLWSHHYGCKWPRWELNFHCPQSMEC